MLPAAPGMATAGLDALPDGRHSRAPKGRLPDRCVRENRVPTGPDDEEWLPRVVALEGCSNMRDLGGYRAADGRAGRFGGVFRSASLAVVK